MQTRYSYPLSNRNHLTNKKVNPLDDPLNYSELYEFASLFEACASVGIWLRNKKRTRGASPDAQQLVNLFSLKGVVQ
jgi:hypothetical protein